MAQTTLDQRMLGVGTALTDHTITASDVITFADVGDSNLTKKDTLQGVLDLAGGAMVFLASQTASSSSTVDFTSGFDSSKYKVYKFVAEKCHPSNDAVSFNLRTRFSGGSFATSGYQWGSTEQQSGGSNNARGGTSQGQIELLPNSAVGNANDESVDAVVYLFAPDDNSHFTKVAFHATCLTNGGTFHAATGGGARDSLNVIDGIQFLFSAGNVDSGTIRMYGLALS